MMADMAGQVLTLSFLRPVKGRKPHLPARIRRILVIRTAYIGDVVMTLPILNPLKKRFPEAAITVLTSEGGKQIVKNHPCVDEILVYEPFWFYKRPVKDYFPFIRRLRQHRFDLVIEARADIRDILFLAFPAISRVKLSYATGGGGFALSCAVPYDILKHKVEYHLDLVRFLGCRIDAVEWGVYLTDNEQQKLRTLLTACGIEPPYICAHPGGRLLLKRWPIRRCAALYDRIMERFGRTLVLLGTASEKDLTRKIVSHMKHRPVILTGMTSIRQLSGLIAGARLMVCNDSAPMHLAAASGTPTVAIFGPSKSVETGPWGPGHVVVEAPMACRHTCDESHCRNRFFHACMEAVPVDAVYQAVERQLTDLDPFTVKER